MSWGYTNGRFYKTGLSVSQAEYHASVKLGSGTSLAVFKRVFFSGLQEAVGVMWNIFSGEQAHLQSCRGEEYI